MPPVLVLSHALSQGHGKPSFPRSCRLAQVLLNASPSSQHLHQARPAAASSRPWTPRCISSLTSPRCKICHRVPAANADLQRGGGGSNSNSGGGGGPPDEESGTPFPWWRSVLPILFYLSVLLLIRQLYALYVEAEEKGEEATFAYLAAGLGAAITAFGPWLKQKAAQVEWKWPSMEIDRERLRSSITDLWQHMREGFTNMTLTAGEKLKHLSAQPPRMTNTQEVASSNGQDGAKSKSGDSKGFAGLGTLFLVSVLLIKVFLFGDDAPVKDRNESAAEKKDEGRANKSADVPGADGGSTSQ